MDALIFVSCYEGFGMPILEAMECGCPTIASEYASIPEIGGDAVLYVKGDNPADWAEAFLDRLPQCRGQLIEKGYQRAAKYSWNAFAELWRGYLRELGVGGKRIAAEPVESLPLRDVSRMLNEWASHYFALSTEAERRSRVVDELARQLDQTFFSRCVNLLRGKFWSAR